MKMNRREFLLSGSVAAALPGSVLAAPSLSLEELHQAARKEGELTWYAAQPTSQTAELMGRTFTQKYPGVNVNVVRTTAQVAFQRLNQDIHAGVNNCDVFSSTVTFHFMDLKKRGLLLPYEPVRKNEVFEPLRNIDPDNTYHVNYIIPIAIVYNTKLLTEAQAPKTWKELIDPKWAGKIAVGHPGYSGAVGNWVVLMRDLYGWDYFEQLAKLKPHIGRSIVDVVTTVASGERMVGAGPVTTSLEAAAKGNPIANVYPKDGTPVVTACSAVPKNAKHPNAGRLFLEFLLGPENAQIQADIFGTPIRDGAKLREGGVTLANIPTIAATDDQLTKDLPKAQEMWRDTFGI